MKNMRDVETAARLLSIGSEGGGGGRDSELHNLVFSSIPSPPYSEASPIGGGGLHSQLPQHRSSPPSSNGGPGAGGLTLLDPIYSAHLLATLAAASSSSSNGSTRFQLPIPIPLTLPIEYNGGNGGTITIPVTLPSTQLDTILSSWVNQQAVLQQQQMQLEEKVRSISVNNVIGVKSTPKKKDKSHKITENLKNEKNKRIDGNFHETGKKKKNSKSIPEELIGCISPKERGKPVKEERIEKLDKHNDSNNNKKVSDQSSPQDKKAFTCTICSRSFGYKHVLQNHERTHTGEKPYFCNICDKRFTRDHHLKTHMRLHTGEKPYSCSHCEKQFVQVANLRRHLRVHTGEKPYSCEICSTAFSDSNQLKAHVLAHKEQVSSSGKKRRERKAKETTRLILRVSDPVEATVSSTTCGLVPPPEQTHPEDLSPGSTSGNASSSLLRSASCSPSSTYCNSVSSSSCSNSDVADF